MATPLHDYIYFTRLELDNVKSFAEGQYVDLTVDGSRPARWTLILGENNTGKTTILQCLARMRPDVANRVAGDMTGEQGFLPELAAEEDNAQLDALVRNGRDVDCRIHVQLVAGHTLDGGGGRPNGITCTARVERRGGRFNDAALSGERARPFSPLKLFAYGAGRHVAQAAVDDEIPDPVASLFDPKVELIDAERTLQRLDYHVAKFKERRSTMRLRALTEMLATILPDVGKHSDIVINPPLSAGLGSAPHGVRVETPHGQVPLHQLSLGYQTVTAWTVDIAWRLFNAYPASSRPMREPAVVIVDEIDLHLHPAWQREIRRHLTEHFPNVQFIATAHSPLMAQDYLDQNLVLLRLDPAEGEVQIINDPSVVADWSVDQLLTSELFGLASARSPATSEAARRRLELLGRDSLTDDEESELRGLVARFSFVGEDVDPDSEANRRLVDRSAAILRMRRGS
jgi:hypothetical protein